MIKHSSISLTTTVVITLLLSACSEEDSSDNNGVLVADAVPITTQQAKTTDLPIWLQTVGQIRSRTVPTLAAEVEGRITLVSADTGDTVAEGQLLAETDITTLLLQQQAAQASLERLDVHIANGKRRVERYQSLSDKNLSSQTVLDDATEQLEAYLYLWLPGNQD